MNSQPNQPTSENLVLRIEQLNSIGLALSSERDPVRLLEPAADAPDDHRVAAIIRGREN